MNLQISRPALMEAYTRMGKDITKATQQEMRSLVCAQCHVEYYFKGDGKYLVFPWANGTKIEDIAQFYTDIDFKDWDQPDSGSEMIKMQHPEYELYTAESTHYLAGVACADCHMPYVREGAAKYSSHDVHSPLLNAEVACGACHNDVGYATTRVSQIQEQVNQTMIATEDAIIQAINAIEAAAALENVNSEVLADARQLHREAQLRWDFIAAENSMGLPRASA